MSRWFNTVLLLGLLVCCGCDRVEVPPTPDAGTRPEAESEAGIGPLPPLRPASSATEYIELVGVLPSTDAEALGRLRELFAPTADGTAQPLTLELQPGLSLERRPDPRTSTQVLLALVMDVSGDAQPSRRTIARVPASLDYGSVFLDVVEAALSVAAQADAPTAPQPFRLEYRTRSAQGGSLTVALDWTPGETQLVVTGRTPVTSLEAGEVGTAATRGGPYESIYGRVVFTLSRDEFDFFATRAYGISAGKSQNFNDFQLLPHSWLRLTVTPKLDDQLVQVGFDVVTADGRRFGLAEAPASLLAGEQFMQSVFRMVDNMEASETAAPGTSPSWRVPYYYDDPNGGGIVEVIASGGAGVFSIDYAVETPVNYLREVEFVGYQGSVEVPDDWDVVETVCEPLAAGGTAEGAFEIAFAASSTVRASRALEAPLVGPIWGSVFRTEDVTIAGPKVGAVAVADFHFEQVDLRDGTSPRSYRLDTPLPAGEYQILGFMDIDGNAEAGAESPDVGDPVMIPIGGYTLGCAVQPVTAEFAILLPFAL